MANNTKKSALQFQKEFVAPGNKLYCNICACIVSSDRKSTILKHRSSKKHINGLTRICYANFFDRPRRRSN